METRANYVIVGIFTMVAVLAAFAFVYWTARYGDQTETALLRVRIPGSASGLGRGSAVLFNGVKVGDVQRVYIDVKNPTVAIADTQVDRQTPISASTLADVGLAGLTGQANIELKGVSIGETNLLDQAEQQGTIAEITANPSAVTNLLQYAQQIFRRADAVLVELEGFTKDVRGPLTESVANAQKFSEALGRNADGIDKFLENFGKLSESLGTVSDQLNVTLKAAENLITAVDRSKVESIVSNIEGVTEQIRQASNRFDAITASAQATLETASGIATRAGGALDKVDAMLDGVDPGQLKTALNDFAAAGGSAKSAAADIAEVTGRIGERAEDINQVITDARLLSGRLAEASVRIDGILQKVDKLLGSGEAEGVMAEASATLKSFRAVVDQLNQRIGPITDGLARFSGQGLRDVEALVRDSRRSIERIEQSISDLERNPQRIITGGEGEVRQYDGRARR